MTRRRLLAGLAATLVLLAAAAGALYLYMPHWRPSEAAYPVQGIDVSHHQNRIDWAALPAQGVDFAYIKATEGGDHRDRMFAANWQGAAAAGIPRGAYHFYTLCRSGAEQAMNFAGAVPREPDALAPAIDLEFGGNCAARPPRAALLRELAIFLRIVETHSGKPAILYLTPEFEAAYRISAAIPRRLWLRRLVRAPNFGGRPWDIWQAASFHSLKGIEGGVDWNAARRLPR